MTAAKNHTIRVSEPVFEFLTSKRGTLSFDVFLRRVLGLSTRKRQGKNPEALREAWVLPSRAFRTQAEAKGIAITDSVKSGEPAEKPIRMREVV